MDKNSNRVSVTVTEQDYMRLVQLARESNRTVSGYFRWLTHRHFRELEREKRSAGQDGT